MRILLVGDSHGNDMFFQDMCETAVRLDCDVLFQVGDFGYWEHYPEGGFYLDACAQHLETAGIDGYWLDGNHENHPMLWNRYGPGGPDHNPTFDGFWEIRPGLNYAPRGHRWTWGGVDFLSIGGAYSVDKPYRKKGSSWWPEETITDDDVDRCGTSKVDVILSHDSPWQVDIPSLRAFDKNQYPGSRRNREQLERVVKNVRPYFLVHGHYHERYSTHYTWPVGQSEDGREVLWHKVQIEGLGHDMGLYQDAYVSIDTDEFNASRPGT